MFSKKKVTIEHDIAELEAYLADVDKHKEAQLEKAKDHLNFSQTMLAEFRNGDTAKRREIFQLIGHDHQLKDRQLHISIQKPLQVLEEARELWEEKKPLKSQVLLSALTELKENL